MDTTTESFDESPRPAANSLSSFAAELYSCAENLRSLADEAPALMQSGRTADRRALYARSELLAMRVSALKSEREGDEKVQKISEEDIAEIDRLLTLCASLSDQAKLVFRADSLSSHRGARRVIGKALRTLDELFRLLLAVSFLIVSGTLLALPCNFLVPLDYLLMDWNIIAPSQQISVNCKRFIAWGVLKLSGIKLVVQREREDQHLGGECSNIFFSHSSTLDAFVLSAVCAVRHYTLSKSELFLIPFFSWCLVAFGGIPIDRKNRDKAVRSLKLAISSARGGDCLSISPEGTRSKTGQILPFKKGPFYMWEEVKTPIVPLIIYGAFELYPTKHYMTLTGRVYCRVLEAIPADAANSREEMSLLVRRKMLEAWRDGPDDAGAELTFAERVEIYLWTALYLVFLLVLYSAVPWQTVQHALGVSAKGLVGWFFVASFGITLLMYVHLMYLNLPLAAFKQRLFGSTSL